MQGLGTSGESSTRKGGGEAMKRNPEKKKKEPLTFTNERKVEGKAENASGNVG